jgi:hypothetical protein
MSLESKFNASTDFIGVLSVGGVLISGILLLTPIQGVGYIGIGSGLGAFTASVVVEAASHIANEQSINITITEALKASAKEEEILAKPTEATYLKTNCSQPTF